MLEAQQCELQYEKSYAFYPKSYHNNSQLRFCGTLIFLWLSSVYKSRQQSKINLDVKV